MLRSTPRSCRRLQPEPRQVKFDQRLWLHPRSSIFRRMLTATLATLLGQPDVSAFLRGIVGRGRYANAYLFHGPHGVGKATAALAFARAVLCERVPGAAPAAAGPSLFEPSDAGEPLLGDDACGECRGCRMSGSLQH